MRRAILLPLALACACGFDSSAGVRGAADANDGPGQDAATPDAAQPDAGPQTACSTDSSFQANPATGQRYFVSSESTTWDHAQENCAATGSYLVVIDDADEQSYVLDLFASGQRWIGANDKDTEGAWVWVNGAAFSFARWAYGEPNDFFDEDCATMPRWTGGYWLDFDCESPVPFVCECDS